MINTVSPTSAGEIQGPEHGFGFDGVVRSRADDIVGILNGVDYDDWDPRSGRHIARPYSPEDLSGKAACKADLLRAYELARTPKKRFLKVYGPFGSAASVRAARRRHPDLRCLPGAQD